MSLMLALIFHAGRFRLLTVAGFICLCTTLCVFASARHNAARPSFEHAQKMREALEGRPEHERTHRDYERVLDAYRAIYHSNPASPKADESIIAVADLLAEEGRVFQDEKALHDAIGQYEFLRSNYPQSPYRYSALLTIGEIYLRDLNDPENARSTFEQFLRLYPRSDLAPEARIELRDLRGAPQARHRSMEVAQNEAAKASVSPASSAKLPAHHYTSNIAEQTSASRSSSWAPSQSSRPADAVSPSLESSRVNEVDLNTSPPQRGRLPLVTGIRYWSTPVYTRVAIDLQDEVRYEAVRVPNPDRIFFDLYGARLSPVLIGKSDQVIDDGFLKQIRAAQFSNNVTRIVLNVSNVSEYSAFFLPNPPRLIIDIHGSKQAKPVYTSGNPVQLEQSNGRIDARAERSDSGKAIGLGPEMVAVDRLGEPLASSSRKAVANSSESSDAEGFDDVAALSSQPNSVRATRQPTTAPVVQSVAGTSPAPQPNELAIEAARAAAPATAKPQPVRNTAKQSVEPAEVHAAQPLPDGEPSLVRTLGLKINRIVIDPGHGGHDSGTLGPGGIEEKDVVLDVALRLGALLKQRLGADVIYTRDDDTFVPLETRTAIANKAQADLFISIHANSSPDPSVRGVETYYLNFTTSEDALEVAARENAVSDQSIHQLADLVKKIALQDKISESREFAADVDQSLYAGLEGGNPGLKDRGVKKAPFVVLIGANMPSILAEISFLTNPDDAEELREPQYRERIAEALYRGVAHYVDSLNGIRLADASPPRAR